MTGPQERLLEILERQDGFMTVAGADMRTARSLQKLGKVRLGRHNRYHGTPCTLVRAAPEPGEWEKLAREMVTFLRSECLLRGGGNRNAVVEEYLLEAWERRIRILGSTS